VSPQRIEEATYFRALATQQAALRRVATLVARGVSPSELFPTVAAEMARCLEVRHAVVCTFEPDDALTIVGAYDEDRPAKLRLGERLTLEGDSIATRVLSNGRPARMEFRDHTPGSVAGWVREVGLPWRVGGADRCQRTDVGSGVCRVATVAAPAAGHGGAYRRVRRSGCDRDRGCHHPRRAGGQPGPDQCARRA
jgi:hypothetical protein